MSLLSLHHKCPDIIREGFIRQPLYLIRGRYTGPQAVATVPIKLIYTSLQQAHTISFWASMNRRNKKGVKLHTLSEFSQLSIGTAPAFFSVEEQRRQEPQPQPEVEILHEIPARAKRQASVNMQGAAKKRVRTEQACIFLWMAHYHPHVICGSETIKSHE